MVKGDWFCGTMVVTLYLKGAGTAGLS